VESFRSFAEPQGRRMFPFEGQKQIQPKLRSGDVVANEKSLKFTDTNSVTRRVRCSYGITTVLQLRYPGCPQAPLPVHDLRVNYNPTRKAQGRHAQAWGGGGNVDDDADSVCVRERRRGSAPTSVTTICSGCGRLIINCDCTRPKPAPRQVQMRYSFVVLDMYCTVAMMSTSDAVPLALTYVTQS
jgi:hypothetical protein